MITVDLAISLFLACAAIGGVLLLLGLLVDDFMAGALDPLHVGFDLGDVGFGPFLLVFVTTFGVGGLVGTRILALDVALSTALALVVGIAAAALWPLLARVRGRRKAVPADNASED